ncbi:hypothetical protein ACP70R_007271 [Stipagrostis hirtigluma subsp. patula]
MPTRKGPRETAHDPRPMRVLSSPRPDSERRRRGVFVAGQSDAAMLRRPSPLPGTGSFIAARGALPLSSRATRSRPLPRSGASSGSNSPSTPIC